MNESRPTAALVTPSGRGAVATVVVTGGGVAELVARCFAPAGGTPLAEVAENRIVFGRWGGVAGEELVVCCRSPERVEIHCHGGKAAAAAILDALAAESCNIVNWSTQLQCDEPDPIRAAAIIALSQARTERAAGILLDQWHGALRSELEQVVSMLDDSSRDALPLLDALLGRAALGLHLAQPFRVVLAGPPNVGKSSLINALVGYRRAIVADQPGTTRDVVTATAAIDGWPVELADTAGLRATSEPIESEGVQRARVQLAAADVVVLVFDMTRPWQPADDELIRVWPGAIIVHNKADLVVEPRSERPPGLMCSAVAAPGVAELEAKIGRRLVPEPPPSGAGVPFTAEQVAALRAAREAIEGEDVESARAALGTLMSS